MNNPYVIKAWQVQWWQFEVVKPRNLEKTIGALCAKNINNELIDL